MDDWGIYVADCYASNKPVPIHLRGYAYKVKASEMVREVFPRSLWYLGDKGSLPIMVDPKRRYQDLRMEQYWRNRDGQVGHEETYQGSTTYIMHVAGELRYLNMRQRARRVKLMLDWVVHGRRMQLMGVDSSGRCPICMERDSLEHMIFACRYSMAIQKRQTWSDGIRTIIAGHTPWTGRRSSGRADQHLCLMQLMQELFERHPDRILLWRTIWPASMRETLAQECGGLRYPQKWAADLDRRFLARTVHLFTKLAFEVLVEISGMRYEVAVQINSYLRTLPGQDTEHIPRLMHAEKLRLFSDPHSLMRRCKCWL